MKQRKIPERLCLGCNVSKPKKELIRVVKNKDGEIFIDKTGKAGGRGAYVCDSAECLEKAIKAKRLSRAFGAEIPTRIYDELREEIKNEQ